MSISVWCRTDKGLRRESNQDSFLINKSLGLFIVADGMGGHSGGEVASSLAVKTVEEVFKAPPVSQLSSKDLIGFAFSEASRRIFDKAANENPELTGMGTTMVMVYYHDHKFYVANVGDSRVYLFRRPHIWQLTEDHSLVNEQLRAGLINEDQVKSFVGRNVITRSVGYEREVVADILERQEHNGDVLMLCSDGLSGMISDEKMSEIMTQHRPEEMVDQCLEAALQNGGDDNVTVMVIAVT